MTNPSPIKLSVIIVNYNVKYFLEQCLHAALKASQTIATEIFVVDNNSVDGSCQMVREKFPTIKLIENSDNKGFSKANNQAIRQSSGEYVLLLNPDTIVEEDSFTKCVHFMDQHPEAGGLGVKMIDGKGHFLPESKRGLPTPMVALYKITGLSALFKRSKRFARYHMGHLDKDQTNEVEVLAGAYMLMRKTTLDKVGLLDEDYFMYGEDIDLSYRITLGGFKNYYFADTTIIHYKGESTKKGSINYVKIFYQAMVIFAKKHFSKGRASFFSILINLAIYFRAWLAICTRIAKNAFLPLVDAFVIYGGFLWLLPYWENYKFHPDYYPPKFLNLVVPIYILMWLAGIWFAGGYRKPIKISNIFKGLIWGTIAILIFHSLIDDSLRFSRALILLGSAWAFLSLLTYRLLLSPSKSKRVQFDRSRRKRIVLIAGELEAQRIKQLIEQSQMKIEIIGLVQPNTQHNRAGFLGNLNQLTEIIQVHKIEELIFSATDLPSQKIIEIMLTLSKQKVEYKIAPPESLSIIGSSSIDTAGELYVVHLNAITTEKNRRNKRLVDFFLALLILISYPLSCWTVQNKRGLLRNSWLVLWGKKSWVGFAGSKQTQEQLPQIKPGILTPANLFSGELSEKRIMEIDIVYAKDYRIKQDAEIIWQAWKKLGQ